MSARTIFPLATALVLALGVTAPAAPAALGDHARVVRDAQTDAVQFVGTERGRPIARPAGFDAASAPADVGRAFLERNRAAFGLGAGTRLRVERSTALPRGVTSVRYQQVLSGVPVLGGELTVQLDAQNDVLSTVGEAEPADAVDTWPSISRQDAARVAADAVAKETGAARSALTAAGEGLRIYDSRIMGAPGLGRPTLVWSFEVGDGAAIRRMVLVDARLGAVVQSIERNPQARTRRVCDAGNTTSRVPCTAPYDLAEGGTYTGTVADVTAAYAYAGGAYDFYWSRLGRDSVDGAGMPLVATVRYCDPAYSCPYGNAYWDGELNQTVFGAGFASADDIVAHELTHGVTEKTSRLFYAYQSGAVSEAMSDIFGELVDQATTSPDDAPGDRWLIGESHADGAVRDMADPTAFGDPDSMTSPDYVATSGDMGGVHSNSGVGNKAAYLMADGGTFNGTTVSPIGTEKVARLFYAVQTGYLVSASDYGDLGNALDQACENLVGTGGFTPGDCDQVRSAVTATRMLTERPNAIGEAECTGGSPSYVWADDLEGAARWSAGAHWYLPQNTNPYGFDASYYTSPDTNIWGYDYEGTEDSSITMTSGVVIPAGAFLSFEHAWFFEYAGTSYYDGGVVEVSTDGGATWSDVGGADYPGTISAAYDNPLGGRAGFVGWSGGTRKTVMSLSALAGQTARVRFRKGSDASAWSYGWFIDDVHIGTCGAQAPPGAETRAAVDVGTTSATLRGAVDPNGAATSYQFEWGASAAYGSVTPDAPAAAGSGDAPVARSRTITGLAPGTTYHYRVVAVRGAARTYGGDVAFTTAGGAPAPPAAPPAATPPATTTAPSVSRPRAVPDVGALLSASGRATRTKVTFTRLVARGVPAGATITAICTGRKGACAFGTKRLVARTATVDLIKAFAPRRHGRPGRSLTFRPGAVLTVKVAKAGMTTATFRWRIVKSRFPKVVRVG